LLPGTCFALPCLVDGAVKDGAQVDLFIKGIGVGSVTPADRSKATYGFSAQFGKIFVRSGPESGTTIDHLTVTEGDVVWLQNGPHEGCTLTITGPAGLLGYEWSRGVALQDGRILSTSGHFTLPKL